MTLDFSVCRSLVDVWLTRRNFATWGALQQIDQVPEQTVEYLNAAGWHDVWLSAYKSLATFMQ